MRVAFALPAPQLDWFREVARRHAHLDAGHASDANGLAGIVAAERPDAALVSAEPRYLDAHLLAACDAAGTRLVAVVGSDVQRRYAASLGIFETVPDDAVAIPVRLSTPAPPVPTAGRVIAVWGPAGSPGRTTVAVDIAAELAAAGRRVVLADVDTHGASIAPALGLLDEAPGFAAACRLASTDSLTIPELERIGQRYESPLGGFWVLTGIGRASRWPELSAERVTRTIARCREWADDVVLDTAASLENDEEIASDLAAPRRNAATIAALREADEVVAVGAADPVGLSRFLRSHVDLLETATTHRVRVVMNRVRASAIGLDPQSQVTQTLQRFGGIRPDALVPHDQNGADAAILTGRTLADAAPRSPARLALRGFVENHLLPPELATRSARRSKLRAQPRGMLRRRAS
ncbi:MinD-like ATPase involved in chromosome partitioning or flagellar assembly [Diaminobutyricimonas aerilata]|uniref:MinD-like ATPase involved in chromosome partitioning or flagellar assembly n=1 Tax=Diaminobutyricimonas aerilata TaxID=1162967 RepID=A0A2M9CHB0_9MICO|nr:MinD-like ATPase involved in chromosome partitioning or flagellar assembly [Diaminobutyricimonas aerilata]